MSYLYKSILLLLGAVAWAQIAFAEGPQKVENHPKYDALKEQVEIGDWWACTKLAKLYEKYDQNAEAFKYWECALRKIKPRNPTATTRHLAGHYFYGIGVEVNVEKAAMYLMLSGGKNQNWSHIEKKDLKTFFNYYHDITDIPDIEEKFKAGAELAKKNVELHELSDELIDRRLSRKLRRIQKTKDGTVHNKAIYLILFLFGLMILKKWFGHKTRES